jgi:hypothetical protein
MTIRDQSLISFLVAVFCLASALAIYFTPPPDGKWIVGAAIMFFLGLTCLRAGVPLWRRR